MLHGVGHCLPKEETLLRRGKVCVSIEQRISADNTEFRAGKESIETARLVRHFYQDRYAEICRQEEDLNYYRTPSDTTTYTKEMKWQKAAAIS